jgi:hypothetical protein
MSEGLTSNHLDQFEAGRDEASVDKSDLFDFYSHSWDQLVEEIRARQAADLTYVERSDVAYLIGFVECLRGMKEGERPDDSVGRALSLLDRLVKEVGR